MRKYFIFKLNTYKKMFLYIINEIFKIKNLFIGEKSSKF